MSWQREMHRDAVALAWPGSILAAEDVVTLGVDWHHGPTGGRPFPAIALTVTRPGCEPATMVFADRAARAFWLRLVGGPIRDVYTVEGAECWWCGVRASAEYDLRQDGEPIPTWPDAGDHVHEQHPPAPEELLRRATRRDV